MTIEQAKSELMQIYGALSPNKQQAIDTLVDDSNKEYLKGYEDAISRQAVMDCFKKWQPYMATMLWNFEKKLLKLPPVNPQEPKTGHWINYPQNSGIVVCNQCKGIRRDCRIGYMNYCNRCGAKMEEGSEE